MNLEIKKYWNNFIKENNLKSKKLNYTGDFYFGHTEQLARELFELVLLGIKKATFSLKNQFEIENKNFSEVGTASLLLIFWKP